MTHIGHWHIRLWLLTIKRKRIVWESKREKRSNGQVAKSLLECVDKFSHSRCCAASAASIGLLFAVPLPHPRSIGSSLLASASLPLPLFSTLSLFNPLPFTNEPSLTMSSFCFSLFLSYLSAKSPLQKELSIAPKPPFLSFFMEGALFLFASPSSSCPPIESLILKTEPFFPSYLCVCVASILIFPLTHILSLFLCVRVCDVPPLFFWYSKLDSESSSFCGSHTTMRAQVPHFRMDHSAALDIRSEFSRRCLTSISRGRS